MSDAFPFIGTKTATNPTTLPMFYEYAWDFEEDCFINDENGNHILLSGNDALKVWIYKALRTERFNYLAYTWRYGVELHQFIGKVMGVKERKSELKRYITECLMVNPYIKAIDKYEFVEDKRGRDVQINIYLTTIYGELIV